MDLFDGFPTVLKEGDGWVMRTKHATGNYATREEAEASAECWLHLKFDNEEGRSWVERLADALQDGFKAVGK